MGPYIQVTSNAIIFTIRVESGQIIGVFLGLVLFGVFYNTLVAWLEEKAYIEGFVSLSVAAGVAVTLAGVALISWPAALLVLVCFVASGLPMIVGSIVRYIQQRANSQKQIISEVE